MVATVDLTKLTPAHPFAQMERSYPAKIVKATLDTGKQNLGAGDTAQLINVNAGMYLLGVGYRVVTAEGGAVTFDIGDDGGAAGLASNLNGNLLAAGFVATGAKFYSANDTIDVTVDGATDAMVVEIYAALLDFTA